MRIITSKFLTPIVASLLLLTGSAAVANAEYEWYEYAGEPTRKPTKPTKAPTGKPTKPATPAPTPIPVNTDQVCVTDGGYATSGSICINTWTFQANAKGNKMKQSGCAPITTKVSPFVDPLNAPVPPVDSSAAGFFCATVGAYVKSNKGKRSSWGYCSCYDFAISDDTASALKAQTKALVDILPKAGKDRFLSLTKPATKNWVGFLPMHFNLDTDCVTSGGFATDGAQCAKTWTFANGAEKVTINGCADIAKYAPFTTKARKAGPLANSKAWCATVEAYDKKSTVTQKSWGYCDCIADDVKAGINAAIASYNGLTLQHRKELLASL